MLLVASGDSSASEDAKGVGRFKPAGRDADGGPLFCPLGRGQLQLAAFRAAVRLQWVADLSPAEPVSGPDDGVFDLVGGGRVAAPGVVAQVAILHWSPAVGAIHVLSLAGRPSWSPASCSILLLGRS